MDNVVVGSRSAASLQRLPLCKGRWREVPSFRASDRVTGVGIRSLVSNGRTESSAPTHQRGNPYPSCLPLRGRWQREALTEGGMAHGFLSPSRLRRQPPRRGNLTARRGRADGTSYPKGICSAALHCGTPSPTHVYRRRTVCTSRRFDDGRAQEMCLYCAFRRTGSTI